MKPYYEDDRTTLYRADCFDVMAGMPDGSVNLIATDPPYYKVKGEHWDRQWDKPGVFLAWLDEAVAEWARLLKPNGSLYVFASPKMAARVEVLVGERLNVLNRIRWVKEHGWHRKADKDGLRSYLSPWEEIIFAEPYGADGAHANAEDRLRGDVFAPLREYLRGERDAAALSTGDVDAEWQAMRNSKGCMAGHWFGVAQWELPTVENYEWLRTEVAPGHFTRPYEDLRREYEDLRREYEDLRRPFSVTSDVPFTDVWDFPTVSSHPGKHPTEKPLVMMEHIVRASSREGDVVFDPFMGSGTTLMAARNLGRVGIGCDRERPYIERAVERLGQVALSLEAP